MLNSVIVVLSLIATIIWSFQLIFAYLTNQKITTPTSGPVRLSVIIPSFNESKEQILKTVLSVHQQKMVDLEIIVVDDGSDVPISLDVPTVKIIRLDRNQGKRYAQMVGIREMSSNWVVTVDSDTTLDDLAIYNLYQTVILNNAKAATGTVNLSNANQNVLTRSTACMYWFSFFQERAAQSYFNTVVCCSGALSIFDKQTILKYEKLYLDQTFLGKKCIAGDDRQLTLIFLLDQQKVCWSKNAVAYTHSPPTMTGFIKQQIRWARSHVPSMWYLLCNLKKCSALLLLFVAQLNFRYFYQLLVYIYMVILCISQESLIPVIPVVIAIGYISIIKMIISYTYTKSYQSFYLLFYSMISFFVLSPVILYGVFTPFREKWLTRS